MSDDENEGIEVPDYIPTSLTLSATLNKCAKCGVDTTYVVKQYHITGVYGSTPCGSAYTVPELKTLGEHLCCACDRCGYTWSERINGDGA